MPTASRVDQPLQEPPPGVATVAKGFHIASLDGIRAVAFAIVFTSHAITESIPGGFGVTIFFFLSGYLITTLLRVEQERTGTISLSNFYARRALRIFPNFYLVLIVATLLAQAGLLTFVGGQMRGWGVFWQALYGNNYYSVFRGDAGTVFGTGVFWSLAIEEHFYFIFPALYLLLIRLTPRVVTRVAVLAGLCVLVLAWRCVVVFATDLPHEPYTYKASDARFDSMLFGCMLALVGNPALDTSRRSDRFWLLVASPLAIVVLLSTFVVRNEAFRETFRYTLQGLALVPLFITAIRCHRHWAFGWLDWPAVRYVGVMTYTLYLVHLVILFRLQQAFGSSMTAKLAAATIAFALSLGIAAAIHRLVERPLAAWRKRLHAEGRTSAISTSAIAAGV